MNEQLETGMLKIRTETDIPVQEIISADLRDLTERLMEKPIIKTITTLVKEDDGQGQAVDLIQRVIGICEAESLINPDKIGSLADDLTELLKVLRDDDPDSFKPNALNTSMAAMLVFGTIDPVARLHVFEAMPPETKAIFEGVEALLLASGATAISIVWAKDKLAQFNRNRRLAKAEKEAELRQEEAALGIVSKDKDIDFHPKKGKANLIEKVWRHKGKLATMGLVIAAVLITRGVVNSYESSESASGSGPFGIIDWLSRGESPGATNDLERIRKGETNVADIPKWTDPFAASDVLIAADDPYAPFINRNGAYDEYLSVLWGEKVVSADLYNNQEAFLALIQRAEAERRISPYAAEFWRVRLGQDPVLGTSPKEVNPEEFTDWYWQKGQNEDYFKLNKKWPGSQDSRFWLNFDRAEWAKSKSSRSQYLTDRRNFRNRG